MTLVIPDGSVAVADEWIEWTGGESAYASFDFTNGPSSNLSKYFIFYTQGSAFSLDYEWTEKGLVLTRPDSSSGGVTDGASGLLMSIDSLKYDILLDAPHCSRFSHFLSSIRLRLPIKKSPED